MCFWSSVLILPERADLLSHDASVLEDHERRDAADPESRGQVAVLVHVDLGHRRLAFDFVGDLIEVRGDHLARPAPRRPEIDEHWTLRVLDGLIEAVVGKMHDMRAGHDPSSTHVLTHATQAI
jgi:hypothetical protein